MLKCKFLETENSRTDNCFLTTFKNVLHVIYLRCSVRIVKSWRAGVGKSLYKKRMVAELYKTVPNIPRRKSSNVTIPLHEYAKM
jgi:hypothetical protein